jgi:hypothetical protein
MKKLNDYNVIFDHALTKERIFISSLTCRERRYERMRIKLSLMSVEKFFARNCGYLLNGLARRLLAEAKTRLLGNSAIQQIRPSAPSEEAFSIFPFA